MVKAQQSPRLRVALPANCDAGVSNTDSPFPPKRTMRTGPTAHSREHIAAAAYAKWHQFVDYVAPWQELPADGLPRYPEARPTWSGGL